MLITFNGSGESESRWLKRKEPREKRKKKNGDVSKQEGSQSQKQPLSL